MIFRYLVLQDNSASDLKSSVDEVFRSEVLPASSSDCVVFDFDSGGTLIRDECQEKYPFICAQPAGETYYGVFICDAKGIGCGSQGCVSSSKLHYTR